MNEHVWSQLTPPLSFGGFGFRDHKYVSHFAHWGAVARASGYFIERGLLERGGVFELSPESDFADRVNRTWADITLRHHEVLNTFPTPRLPMTGDTSTVVSYYGVEHPIPRFNGDS